MFRRSAFNTLKSRLQEPRRFIQVVMGPRQVGKTTLVQQVFESLKDLVHSASADVPTLESSAWIESQWQVARLLCRDAKKPVILVLDEVQKVPEWSTVVKRLWDEDTAKHLPLQVVLLGSSPLLMQHGLSESLAGRFETISLTHWSYMEMSDAFGWTLEQYIYFGGYPGAAPLIGDEDRWRHYILDALIETTISRDILLLNRVHKPALLRRLFHLGCEYSGRELSFQKMLGQLQEKGNTTTIAYYLELLSGSGMVTGLQKYAGQKVRQRGSSPKLQVYNTALITALWNRSFHDVRRDAEAWGRLVESSIGAHLLATTMTSPVELFYWREANLEVDFVIKSGRNLLGVEVKSGRKMTALSGLERFRTSFRKAETMLVGGQGIEIEKFLSTPMLNWTAS